MAELTLKVGAITSTKVVSNAVAQEILTDFIKANNNVPTSLSNVASGIDVTKLSQQEQLDWVLDQLLSALVQPANTYRKKAVIDTAVVTSGIDGRGWR